MRIGMVLDKIFPADERVEYEAQSLAKAGHRVTIFSYSGSNTSSQEDLGYAKVFRLPINKFFARKFKQISPNVSVFSWLWYKPLSQALRSNPVDALHAHDLYMVPVCLYLRKRMSVKIPIVADLHENYPAALDIYNFANTFPGNILIAKSAWKKKELEWLNNTEKIITVIEESKKYYTQRGVQPQKIHIVPNFVNISQFYQSEDTLEDIEKTPRLPQGGTNLLYIGAINHHRGLQEVIEALTHPELKDHDIKFWIVGDGSYLHRLKKMTTNLNLNNVYFFGRKSHKELPFLIHRSDICLIPHIKSLHTDTTIPHKLTQYMVYKKPIFASNCTPIQRIIGEIGCGSIFESGNILNLTQQLSTLLSRKNDWLEMGERAYHAVQEKYNWQISEDNLTETYKAISIYE